MIGEYKKNIFSLFIIKISKWFNMVMPVVVLFYTNIGMGMHEIFLLKSIYSIAIVAMEIPSGYMADKWGRKKTLIFGSIFGALGFLIYSFSFTFLAFVAAEIVLGIAHSCISGADSAMLFDTLKSNKTEKEYVKIEGRITSAGNFAEALAGIIGGLLATLSLRTPFFFQTVIAASAIPAAFALVEPAIVKNKTIQSVKYFIKTIKDGMVKNADLRTAILFSAATGTATLSFAWLVQPFLKEIGTPIAWFGIIWTLLNLSVGISSIFAHRIESVFSRKKTALIILFLITTTYILSGLSIFFWGILFLFLFYLARGLATPILKNYINVYTDSNIRATVLSVRNFIIRINFAIIGPLLGWVTDTISLKSAFLIAGTLYAIFSIILLSPWIFTKKEQ